jgi:hypothetical protein
MKPDLTADQQKQLLESLKRELETKQALAETLKPKLEQSSPLISEPQSAPQMDWTTDFLLDHGWKPIDIRNLPSKGLGYPEGTRIQIRSATVKEIRYFSSIVDTDPVSVQEKTDTIIKSCVSIRNRASGILHWMTLKQIDKVYLLFAVSELTMMQPETELVMRVQCHSCKSITPIKLKKELLNAFQIDSRLKDFVNFKTGAFTFKVNSSGEEVNLYLPNIGVTNSLMGYIESLRSEAIEPDYTLIKAFRYLFTDYSVMTRDWLDMQVGLADNWSLDKLSAIDRLIDILEDSLHSSVKFNCKCGTEVTAPIEFQSGLKSLFIVPDIFIKISPK